METRKFGEPKTRKLDNPKFKEEEEALRKRFTEQVKLEEARFRQWEQRVLAQLKNAYASLLPNETVSTRTWKLRIHLSSNLKPNWKLWPEVGTGVDRTRWLQKGVVQINLISFNLSFNEVIVFLSQREEVFWCGN